MGVYVVNVKVSKTIEYDYDLHIMADNCDEALKTVESTLENELLKVAVPASKMKLTSYKIRHECKGELNGE